MNCAGETERESAIERGGKEKERGGDKRENKETVGELSVKVIVKRDIKEKVRKEVGGGSEREG